MSTIQTICEQINCISVNDKSKRVRPDIIYHDRKNRNIFCIEFKCGSKRNDDEKIKALIRDYNYSEGYCIYNLGKSRATIEYFHSGITEKHRFKYDSTHKVLANIAL